VDVQTARSLLHALPEVLARQVYWRTPLLQRFYGGARKTVPTAARCLDLDRLASNFAASGIREGCCLMVHSSIDGLWIRTRKGVIRNQLQVAGELLRFLRGTVGPAGTLVMPTHPYYRDDPGFMFDKSGLRLRYDRVRTPSKVGLLTEMFRRSPMAIRSQHPLSAVAAEGPLAESITGGLPAAGDLPHGVNSPYKRLCDAGGLVVSINVPLINALTVVHVAEELRDADWPVKGFFYERTFDIRSGNSVMTTVVRERHPTWVRFISLRALRADLIREGRVIDECIDGVKVGFANAAGVVDYMLERNASSTYPYFLLCKERG